MNGRLSGKRYLLCYNGPDRRCSEHCCSISCSTWEPAGLALDGLEKGMLEAIVFEMPSQ